MAEIRPRVRLRSECAHLLAVPALLPLAIAAGPAKGGRVVVGVPSIEEWGIEVWLQWVLGPISNVPVTPLTPSLVFLRVDLPIAAAVWELQERLQVLAFLFW